MKILHGSSLKPVFLSATRYQDILVEVGYNNGVPIDWDFFNAHISGRHNPEICAELFPDWTEERQRWIYETKEERFREMAGGFGTTGMHACWR